MPIKKNKISYKLDLEDFFESNNIKPSKRKELSELAGATLLGEVLAYLDRGITPVSKGQYKKSLSPEYKKVKKKKGGSGIADMQLSDDMLNSIQINPSTSGVEIKIADTLQKKKAYNHNKGDTLPQRQWLPDDELDETFKATIIKRVKDTIKDASED